MILLEKFLLQTRVFLFRLIFVVVVDFPLVKEQYRFYVAWLGLHQCRESQVRALWSSNGIN